VSCLRAQFVFSQDRVVLSGELHFDLNIGSLGNWLEVLDLCFVAKKRGIISRNMFKQPRETVIVIYDFVYPLYLLFCIYFLLTFHSSL